MEHLVVEYIKHGHTGRKIGVMVAYPYDDKSYCVGWSVCHPDDKFDRQKGRSIAVKRAVNWKSKYETRISELQGITHSWIATEGAIQSLKNKYRSKMTSHVNKNIVCFLERCDKYFKNMERPKFLSEVKRKDRG